MPDPVRRLHEHSGIVAPLPTRWVWLVVRLERADVSATEWAQIVSAALAMLPLGATVAVVGHPAAGLLVALCAPAVPVVALVRWRRRRDLRLADRLPATLEQMVRLLRAGRTPRQALERAAQQAQGPLAPPLLRVTDALRLGAAPDRALSVLCDREGPRAMARVAAVLRLVLDGGGGAADAIEGLAASLRHDRMARERVEMLTAQARLSVRTLTALPLMFVALGALGGTAQTAMLLTTDVGRICAVAGGALLATGHAWMMLLVRRVGR